MALNEREQKILEEIERQFRAEDPDLARAASSLPMARFATRNVRILIAGIVIGLVLMLATFSINSIIALVGFGLMVMSVTGLVQALARAPKSNTEELVEGDAAESSRIRWPFRR